MNSVHRSYKNSRDLVFVALAMLWQQPEAYYLIYACCTDLIHPLMDRQDGQILYVGIGQAD